MRERISRVLLLSGLLAVLPQDGRGHSTDLIECLRNAALSANMDFLCRSGEHRRF